MIYLIMAYGGMEGDSYEYPVMYCTDKDTAYCVVADMDKVVDAFPDFNGETDTWLELLAIAQKQLHDPHWRPGVSYGVREIPKCPHG